MRRAAHAAVLAVVFPFACCGDDGSADLDGGGDVASDTALEGGEDALGVDADAAAMRDMGAIWDGRVLPDVVWSLPECARRHGVIERAIIEAGGRPLALAALAAADGRIVVAWDSATPRVGEIVGDELNELELPADSLPFEISRLAVDLNRVVVAGTWDGGGAPILGAISSSGGEARVALSSDPPWAAYEGIAGLWIGADDLWIAGVLQPRGDVAGEPGTGLRLLHFSESLGLLEPPFWLETDADTMFPGVERGLVTITGGPQTGMVIRKVISDERGRSPRALELIPFEAGSLVSSTVVTLHGAYAGIDGIDAADDGEGAVVVLLESQLLDVPAGLLLTATVSSTTGAPDGDITTFAEPASGVASLTSSSGGGVDLVWQPAVPELLGAEAVLDMPHPLAICRAVRAPLEPCVELEVGAGAYADGVLTARDGNELVVIWHESGPLAAGEGGVEDRRRAEGIYWASLDCER